MYPSGCWVLAIRFHCRVWAGAQLLEIQLNIGIRIVERYFLVVSNIDRHLATASWLRYTKAAASGCCNRVLAWELSCVNLTGLRVIFFRFQTREVSKRSDAIQPSPP